MTISSADRKSQLYIGSGTTGPFAFPFKVFAASEVAVTTSVIATGVETPLSAGEYTVNLNADQDGNPGGSITLATALPTTKNLIITSAVPLTQPVNINNQDGFFAEVVEDALDRSVIQVQQMQAELDRAFKVPLTSGYTDPNEFITDLLNTDAAAQTAKLGAEAARDEAVVAKTAAEAARDGAQQAETNAESYVDIVTASTSTVYADYTAAITALGAGDDGTVFRLRHQERYYVYVYNESGDYGILQYVVPVDGIDATIASAASNGVTPSGQSIPSGALVDIVGVDGLFSHSDIRNRAVVGRPDDNSPILRNTDVTEQPLRGHITPKFLNFGTIGDPSSDAGTVTFGSDGYGNYVQMDYLAAIGNIQVKLPVDLPPGRYQLNYDYWSDLSGQSFLYSVNGGSSWSALSASGTLANNSVSITKTDFGVLDIILCADDGNLTPAVGTASRVRLNNIVLRPGTATTYTPPAIQHGWHRRSWSIDANKFVGNNDSAITSKMHVQVPLNEERDFEEVTVSLAVKATSNKPAQAINITAPAGQAFSTLLTPSFVFTTDLFGGSGTAGGYIGFNGLGSVDDIVQVTEVALPLDKWAVLTIVCPKEEGINSSPTRIYINGILLREVQDLIAVKTTARVNDADKLRFDFGKNHWFVENQPVTVTVPTGQTYPGGITAGTTYYVRLPADNPQERLYLASSVGGDPIEYTTDGSGSVSVQSQRRPVGVVPFKASILSLLGAGNTESAVLVDSSPFNLIGGLNLEGEFANAVVYDRALTDAEVINLVAVQKQRIASHYESASSLGNLLLMEGDSITFGVGTSAPSETFRYRLFYGMDFNKKTVTSVTTTKNELTISGVTADTNAVTIGSVTDDSGTLAVNFTSSHRLYTDDAIQLTTNGSLPAGLLTGTTYYVLRQSANKIYLSTSLGGAAIAWNAAAGSGEHTATLVTGRLKLAFAAPHNFLDSDTVWVSSTGTLPGGLSASTNYYVRYYTPTELYLSTTQNLFTVPVAYSSAGTGTRKLAWSEDKIRLSFASAHGYLTQDSIQLKTTNTLPAGLTDQDVYFVRKISDTEMSVGYPIPSQVVAAGSVGYGTTTVQRFVPTLDNTAFKTSNALFATSGSVIGDTYARKGLVLDKIQRAVAEGTRPIVIYMAGMNDLILGYRTNPGVEPPVYAPLNTAVINVLATSLIQMWSEWRAAGAKIIVCTVTAANESAGSTGFYTEALRSELNAKIRSLSSYYDALADFGATPQLGTWTDPAGVSYFFDDIHPDFQGHIVMSNILSPLVDAFRL